MIQFYAPDIERTFTLPESDSQHCIRVLRHKEGDLVEVIDGRGGLYTCRIVSAHPKHAGVEIIDKRKISLPWSYDITVAVAPTKLVDRMEWMVEKLVEIGVNRIVFLQCDHSERKEIKLERIERIAVSAMKQSLKTTMPVIQPMTKLKTFVDELGDNYSKYVAYCDKLIERHLLSCVCEHNRDTVVLIGPEGDFSPEEVDMLVARGFIPISLGECRLRTETAAVTACDTIHIVNQIKNCLS